MKRNRRQVLQVVSAVAGAAGLFNPLPSPAMNFDNARLDTLVDAAFEYAFPLYEMARTRYNALDNPANPMRNSANRVGHRRNLATHRNRDVTTPNNDTLYSGAWLDLSAGPLGIDIAAQPAGRYWSVALMDFFTNHVAILGSRLDGAGPVQATLVGPNWRGALPTGRVIHMPGNDAWLLGRWLAEGAHDLEAARAMQDRLRLSANAEAAAMARVAPRHSADAENFLAVVNQALARNPGPKEDAADLARYVSVGLHAGAGPAWAGLEESVRAAWQRRIAPAHEALRAGLMRSGSTVQGWRQPPPPTGDFGREHALRAAVALGGLAALPPIEAVYLSRQQDASGQALDGAHRYRVRIPPGGVPCQAFWSLSVYERMPDGRLFFIDHPGARYAIGDRSPGIGVGPDGAMDIWLQAGEPADAAQRANWLPIRPGPLHLTLRAYLPRPALREGTAVLPTLERLG